jgi:hypothetical protein
MHAFFNRFKIFFDQSWREGLGPQLFEERSAQGTLEGEQLEP